MKVLTINKNRIKLFVFFIGVFCLFLYGSMDVHATELSDGPVRLNNFTGEVMLQTGQIGDDLSYYFYTSEQTPSIVVLSVNINKCGGIKCAGGMIVQVLPSASEEDLIEIENKVRNYGNFSAALNTKSIETIISEIFPDFVELSRNDVTYKCDCSKKKFTNIVKLVGIEELNDMIEKDHGCHAVCNFCNKEYNFTEEELIAIRDSIKK